MVEDGWGLAFSAAKFINDTWMPFLRAGYSDGGGARLLVDKPITLDSQYAPVIGSLVSRWSPDGDRIAFLTEGGHAANTFLRMQKRLSGKGVTLVDTFKCLGFDTYPPFIGKDRQLGHPNEEELSAAERFGAGLLERRDRIRAGETELVPTFAGEKGRFARLAVILTRPMLFMISPRKRINAEKCTKCGICVENCPTDNIRLDPYPKFGWRCVYCYWCERSCPEDAIECDWTAMTTRVEKQYTEKEEPE